MKHLNSPTRRWLAKAAFAVALVGLFVADFANTGMAASEIYKSTFGDVAIEGADPVAYFKEGKAVEGSSEFTHDWKQATWRFVSAANRDAFAASPEAYAPQFGGYCAWAVSQGYTAETDPSSWKIVNGKLYLNYSKGVQATWSKDIPGNIAKAEKNWPGVLKN